MKSFLVPIPLFDNRMSVNAYRLCERNGEKLLGTMSDYQEMSDALLTRGLDAVERIGIEPFTGGMPLFVDINRYQMMTGVPANMDIPPDKLVLVLNRDIVEGTDSYDSFGRLGELKELGYELAIDHIPRDPGASPAINIVDYVIFDYKNSRFRDQIKHMKPYMRGKRTVISNIPSTDAYDSLVLTGVPSTMYGGEFYSQPLTKGVTNISPLKVNALQLLSQVSEEDADLTEISRTIERDPSISISLLRFINSPAVGVRQRIDSIKRAVAMLGQREVKRWVIVAVSVNLAEDRPGEITKLSLVRAKFAENLATAYELGVFAPSLFMTGLFSLLDVILEKPMKEAINEIAVDARVRKALVDRAGELYEVMELIYAYERADWQGVTINMIRNGLNVDTITEAYIEALVWYKRLLEEIDTEPADEQAPEGAGARAD